MARTPGHPHPRPVWGVWLRQHLFLSVGTPTTLAALSVDPILTVHLDSGTDVVIVEGRVVGTVTDQDVVAAYDEKYDWAYDPGKYGPLQCLEPEVVLAWRAAGEAGRDGFQVAGRWERAD